MGPGFAISGLFIVIVGILLVTGIGLAIARAVYRSSRGVSPFFAREQAEAAIVNGQLLAPPPARPVRSIEERLADLDDLRARGIITDSELAEARSKIIAEG